MQRTGPCDEIPAKPDEVAVTVATSSKPSTGQPLRKILSKPYRSSNGATIPGKGREGGPVGGWGTRDGAWAFGEAAADPPNAYQPELEPKNPPAMPRFCKLHIVKLGATCLLCVVLLCCCVLCVAVCVCVQPCVEGQYKDSRYQ